MGLFLAVDPDNAFWRIRRSLGRACADQYTPLIAANPPLITSM
jgi:hypothetical protein